MLVGVLPLAWLLPNHYPPWLTAWQDGLVIALLVAAALALRTAACVDRLLLGAVLVAALSVAAQGLAGIVSFGGDVLLVLLYLAAFVLALAVGNGLAATGPGAADGRGIDALALGLTAASVLSAAIALMQWSGAVALGVFGADLPPGARPFANVAQPNHLCTLLFLGLTGVLLLRERGRIGSIGCWTASGLLVVGMAMSGSRTGWLQQALLLVLAVGMAARGGSARVRWPHVVGLALFYAGASALWPWINEALLLTGGRGVGHQLDGGARLPLWRALIDAAAQRPWTGWGWQQVALAQQAVALDHAPVRRHFEHSHNIVLDLVLWAGVPVAAVVVALTGAALLCRLRRLHDPQVCWMLAGAGAILVHAMLELPLEYAYFLVPAGLLLGASGRLAGSGGWYVRPRVLRAAAAAIGVVLLAVGVEYVEAEENHRALRLESARIGTDRIVTPAPELRLLTQLGAFLQFARTDARAGMTVAELTSMRRVSQRFAYAPALYRYALAAGLNGMPGEARRTLQVLCSMHIPQHCDDARAGWLQQQERYPQLRAVQVP